MKCEKCGGIIKPDVVLYEESLDNGTITRAVQAIAEAEVLIIGGTSLSVYPAAGLINYVSVETPVYLIDPQPVRTNGYRHVKQILKGASEGMKELINQEL